MTKHEKKFRNKTVLCSISRMMLSISDEIYKSYNGTNFLS